MNGIFAFAESTDKLIEHFMARNRSAISRFKRHRVGKFRRFSSKNKRKTTLDPVLTGGMPQFATFSGFL